MSASIRTSRADKNYLSWSGDTLMLYLGTDHPEPCDRVPSEVYPEDPSQWDSSLKVSGNTYGVNVVGISAAQCRENVLDINHSKGVTFVRARLGRTGEVGEQVITIKGGSSDVLIHGTIYSRGTNADVVLGQWADQSTARSHTIDLSGLARDDGEPVTVIMVRVDRRTVKLPPKAKVLWLKSLGYSAYWWAKRAWVALRYGKAAQS